MWIVNVRIINEKTSVLNDDIVGAYEVTMSDESVHVFLRSGSNVKVVEFYGGDVVLSNLTQDKAFDFLDRIERY